jgi:hypothetical protein|tara:strand:- start:588 stop:848 length:261 start_codon:yes stop_codon:yes gene_type:complete
MKVTYINNIISIVSLVFLFSLIGCSSGETRTCTWCNQSYRGNGYTTWNMASPAKVQKVDNLNLSEDGKRRISWFCSKKCASESLRK